MGVYGAIAGAIVGGVISYSAQKNAADNKTKAIREAAARLKAANEAYSGENANAAMTARGNAEANQMRNLTGAGTKAYDGATQYAQSQNAARDVSSQMQNASTTGYALGASNQATENAANLAREERAIQNQLKQADVEYNADVARTQGYMNAASGLASLYNQIGNPFPQKQAADGASTGDIPSDEKLKEDPIDDNKLIEAIEQFKALKREVETLSNKSKEQ